MDYNCNNYKLLSAIIKSIKVNFIFIYDNNSIAYIITNESCYL